MDSSASIGPYEYEQEKSFVKDLARIFQEGGTRAGVVIYSDDPEVMVKFDEKNDLESFAKAVDEIEFLGNRTRIDKALESVSKLFLTARREVPKVRRNKRLGSEIFSLGNVSLLTPTTHPLPMYFHFSKEGRVEFRGEKSQLVLNINRYFFQSAPHTS